MRNLIQCIKINSVEEAEEILKAAGTEDLFEKARTEGEMHPNGKLVWTEYKPGKFDWRVAKKGGSKATTVRADASKTQSDGTPIVGRGANDFDMTKKTKSGNVDVKWGVFELSLQNRAGETVASKLKEYKSADKSQRTKTLAIFDNKHDADELASDIRFDIRDSRMDTSREVRSGLWKRAVAVRKVDSEGYLL